MSSGFHKFVQKKKKVEHSAQFSETVTGRPSYTIGMDRSWGVGQGYFAFFF